MIDTNLKNIFHSHNTYSMKFGDMHISESTFQTDNGEVRVYWIKTKSITIERNLCGFCLN